MKFHTYVKDLHIQFDDVIWNLPFKLVDIEMENQGIGKNN